MVQTSTAFVDINRQCTINCYFYNFLINRHWSEDEPRILAETVVSAANIQLRRLSGISKLERRKNEEIRQELAR